MGERITVQVSLPIFTITKMEYGVVLKQRQFTYRSGAIAGTRRVSRGFPV